MLRSFVPEEIDSEYSKHSSIEDVNHKIGQEN